jgi:hypothetical protein
MWPETYIIDRQGVIRRKLVGAQDWSDPEVRAFKKAFSDLAKPQSRSLPHLAIIPL